MDAKGEGRTNIDRDDDEGASFLNNLPLRTVSSSSAWSSSNKCLKDISLQPRVCHGSSVGGISPQERTNHLQLHGASSHVWRRRNI